MQSLLIASAVNICVIGRPSDLSAAEQAARRSAYHCLDRHCLAQNGAEVIADWLFVPHEHQPQLFDHLRVCRGIVNPAAQLADGVLILEPSDGACPKHPDVSMLHVEQCVGYVAPSS